MVKPAKQLSGVPSVFFAAHRDGPRFRPACRGRGCPPGSCLKGISRNSQGLERSELRCVCVGAERRLPSSPVRARNFQTGCAYFGSSLFAADRTRQNGGRLSREGKGRLSDSRPLNPMELRHVSAPVLFVIMSCCCAEKQENFTRCFEPSVGGSGRYGGSPSADSLL
jgi:hypothetical protein